MPTAMSYLAKIAEHLPHLPPLNIDFGLEYCGGGDLYEQIKKVDNVKHFAHVCLLSCANHPSLTNF